MLQIPDTAPQTLEEYNYLVNAVYQNGLEKYELDKAQATQQAEAQWDSQYVAKREHMIAEMEANLAAMTVIGLDGANVPLTATEYQTEWDEGIKKINAQLAQEHEQFIAQAVSMVQQPEKMEQIEATYGFYKAAILQQQEFALLPEPEPYVPPQDRIYKVGDRYWSVPLEAWVSAPTDTANVVVLGGEPTEQNLRETLKANGLPLGPEIMDTEELFVRLRSRRNERLDEYDKKIMQLNRLIRENPDYATYTIQRAAWDAYATALCELPQQSDAPWDGGGPLTPWPAKPE